ncbi:MAG: hypothetical protein V3V01_14865 [Acidimicrobiales bacterium]
MSDLLQMNKAQMLDLKRGFTKRADEVSALRSGLDGLLKGTVWDGRRAREFRSLWDSEFSPNLTRLETALRENGQFIGKELNNAKLAMD